MHSVRDKRWYFVACVPLLFALQQLCEGMVWILKGSGDGGSAALVASTYGFLFFAFVVWPVWIPLSVLAIEPNKKRQKLLRIIRNLGLLLSGILLVSLVLYMPSAHLEGCHVYYDVSYFGTPMAILCAYCIAVVGPLAVSSHKYAQAFGGLVFIACLISLYFYTIYFTSVWCFFSALISALVIIIVKKGTA